MQGEASLSADSDGLVFDEQVAPTSSSLNINYFQQVHAIGDLVLRAAFQRNLVWNETQQSLLVDSILRGLPVPEVYIQRSTSPDGEEETIVVDGQQRITTCLRFLANRLRLVQDDEVKEEWRGKIFAELEPEQKQRFRSFEFIVRKLPDLNESALREVFRRLNRTVESLESQELRHAAYTGPFVKLVEQLAARRVFGEIGVFSAKDYLRRRNDEFFAEVIFATASNAFPNKKEGLDQLFVTYEKQGFPPDLQERLERSFGRILELLAIYSVRLKKTRFRNKSDFYSLLVFLMAHADRLPLTGDRVDQFIQRLAEFSDAVNELKREQANEDQGELFVKTAVTVPAARYLRAVERAASDRLNRVRRNEALNDALGEIFTQEGSKPLVQKDAEWRNVQEVDEDSDDELQEEAEKIRSRQVLLSSRQDDF
ncbi:GmrSD restriction endonuclease domain-containing protein [Amycolatopsis sp. CB00013]|uniref:GmrSD restriction endonuclease domain-containing protein n=1 Tax=Amycolatopsis sp. CB00013 TaxID=1703945 RepID=UPI0009FAE9E4|nr:DUF262 domain-containing protein [Amycolatopsis sp. CB00013]